MVNLEKGNAKQSLLLACLLAGVSPHAAAIDVWDLSGSDGSFGTDNELVSGSEQQHDLQNNAGVADQDWFLLSQAPYSSYEIIVDGLTEEVASIPVSQAADALRLDVVTDAGGVLASSVGISDIGSSRSLRIRNTTGGVIDYQYIRVMSAIDGCTTTCTTNAEYRIRMRETTLMIPRFNNSGTQVTVLIMQNGSRSNVSATARFWSLAGVLLASQPFTMPPRGGYVLQTQTIAPGVSGVMTIDHNGRFGEVTGKTVALEPATGFSFDTPAVPRIF